MRSLFIDHILNAITEVMMHTHRKTEEEFKIKKENRERVRSKAQKKRGSIDHFLKNSYTQLGRAKNKTRTSGIYKRKNSKSQEVNYRMESSEPERGMMDGLWPTDQAMTVAESRRSRRLQTSPKAAGVRRPQATTRRIRCSSRTRCTSRRAGASSSVKGSSQMPSSRMNIFRKPTHLYRPLLSAPLPLLDPLTASSRHDRSTNPPVVPNQQPIIRFDSPR